MRTPRKHMWTGILGSAMVLALFLPLMTMTALAASHPDGRVDEDLSSRLSGSVELVYKGSNELEVGSICFFRDHEKQSIPYRWRHQISDENVMGLFHSEYESSPESRPISGGDVGWRRFYFEALAPGSCVITFRYGPYGAEWDGESSEAYRYAVVVTADAADGEVVTEQPAVFPTSTADALQIKQIDAFLSMSRDEIIEKCGPDYEEVGTGPEGAMDGYYYEDLGMVFAFYPDSDTPELIHCYPSFQIGGVGLGSLFTEVTEALGRAEIEKTWLELPIYTVYKIEYKLGNSNYCFIALEEDGPVDILWISQNHDEAAEDGGAAATDMIPALDSILRAMVGGETRYDPSDPDFFWDALYLMAVNFSHDDAATEEDVDDGNYEVRLPTLAVRELAIALFANYDGLLPIPESMSHAVRYDNDLNVYRFSLSDAGDSYTRIDRYELSLKNFVFTVHASLVGFDEEETLLSAKFELLPAAESGDIIMRYYPYSVVSAEVVDPGEDL